MQFVETVEELAAIYGEPGEALLVKETMHIIPQYRAFIEAAPFCALATVGPEGLDCSPRGDRPGFVRVHDERTLMMPDRRGNNRTDSLQNIVRDPRVALMFMIPGHGNCLRVNGEARVTADAAVCESFAIEEKAPRSVTVIKTQAVYFQCARALAALGGRRAGRSEIPAERGGNTGLSFRKSCRRREIRHRMAGPGAGDAW